MLQSNPGFLTAWLISDLCTDTTEHENHFLGNGCKEPFKAELKKSSPVTMSN